MTDPKTKRPDTPLAATPAVTDSTQYYHNKEKVARKAVSAHKHNIEAAKKNQQEKIDAMILAQDEIDAYRKRHNLDNSDKPKQ